MEEKERYEVMLPSLNGYAYIYDFKTDNVLNTYDSCDLLNQQSKRIKELEKTNKILSNELTKNRILKQDCIETCCGIPIFEIPKMKAENQQLKQQLEDAEENIDNLELQLREQYQLVDEKVQQLHDLPKKIVVEIKQQLFNYFKVKNIEDYEKLPLIDCLFTADTVIEILDTILKKYGGEDE